MVGGGAAAAGRKGGAKAAMGGATRKFQMPVFGLPDSGSVMTKGVP